MAKAIIMGGGGGGVGSDELTATASDVLKGQTYVGSDTNDETGTGTLELTGNATNDQVLTGQTFYNNNAKTIQTGNMPNQGSTSISVGRNESKTIPAGYYNGQGKVNGPSMTDVPGKTITPTESQQTAISAGQYATGNILVAGYSSGTVGSTVPRIGARTLYATTSTITAFPTGNYATGNTTVAAISASIPTGSILNTATVTVSNGQTTILSGKGTIASQGALTYTPTTSTQTASVSGKYMTGNIVINPIPSTYKQVGSTTSFFDFGGMKYLDGNQFNSVDSSGNANNIKNVGTLISKGSPVSLKMAESGSSIANHYFVFRPILRTDIISSNRTADVSFTIKFVGINPSYANAIASCYLQAVKSDGLYNYRAFLSSSDQIIIKDSEFHTLSTQLSEDNANNILAYPYVFPVLRINLSMIGYIAKDSTVTISEFGFKLL